ncbi:hypothetical protein Tco_0662883, partial [Tanacetum coccineum]
MDICTSLRRQHLLMEERVQSHDLEINQLKSRVKTLEENEKRREGFAQEDASNTRGIDQGEDLLVEDTLKDSDKSADKGSGNTDVMANVLEQAERDDEIARVHAERELGMMITEHDRSNEMVAKYLSEYEQAEAELSHNEKVELIDELLMYQRNLAQIKKYQAQQNKPATKTKRRNLYMSILRSNAGWKVKDFKGMSFEQIEEKFILVWKQMQRFYAYELQAVLVSEEVLVDVTPFTVKSPICDWKIFKDRLRDVYQIFRVGQAPKAYPYFFSMLNEFDREDVVTLWKLVKDRFKTELPKS